MGANPPKQIQFQFHALILKNGGNHSRLKKNEGNSRKHGCVMLLYNVMILLSHIL